MALEKEGENGNERRGRSASGFEGTGFLGVTQRPQDRGVPAQAPEVVPGNKGFEAGLGHTSQDLLSLFPPPPTSHVGSRRPKGGRNLPVPMARW